MYTYKSLCRYISILVFTQIVTSSIVTSDNCTCRKLRKGEIMDLQIIPSYTELSTVQEKLKALSENTQQISKNKNSPHTLNSYSSDWDDFTSWCIQYHLEALPASPYAVANYLADRATNCWTGPSGKNRKPTLKHPLKLPTLLHRLWAIKFKHKENGFSFDSSSKVIEDLMSSLRRNNNAKEIRKDPLLLEDIRKISEWLHAVIKDKKDSPIAALTAIRDKALLVFGFVSAMRRSEIASLTMKDITFVEEGVEVHIMQSKTGERELVIPYGSNPLTCPVRAVLAWLKETGIVDGPIFRSINRHGHISSYPISDRSIANIIKNNKYVRFKRDQALQNGDYIPDYSGHSLRAGFVTTAVSRGVPEDLIMSQTGHKKRDTLDKYIRRTNKWHENAATRIGL